MGELLPLQKMGLLCTIIYSLLVIVLIFLIGFDYKLIDYRWTSQGPFRHLAVVSVACVVVIFCSVILSFVAFIMASRFLAFQGVSMCFSFGTTVFSFMASAPGSIDDYIGCNSRLKGFVELWESIDHYLIAADQILCSSECKCNFQKEAEERFKQNLFVAPFFGNFWVQDSNSGVVKFQDCKNAKPKDHFTEIDKTKYDVLVNGFDEEAFIEFWANMEETFNCTGWCTTSYDYNSMLNPGTGPNIPRQGMMYKFLFTDINLGIPKHIGCMGEYIKYTKRMVKTYSSCLLIACVLQILSFSLGISLICQGGKAKEIAEEDKPRDIEVNEHKL